MFIVASAFTREFNVISKVGYGYYNLLAVAEAITGAGTASYEVGCGCTCGSLFVSNITKTWEMIVGIKTAISQDLNAVSTLKVRLRALRLNILTALKAMKMF